MTKQQPSILIVDDDHEVADTLAYIVSQCGYDVTIAYDGEWALQLASRTKFDVAFLDVLLPGMNGVECFIKLKEFCPKATVFMMTGYASEHLAALALQKGASDVMRKPVMPEEQTSRPPAGSDSSKPFFARFSSKKYSVPSARTRIL